MAVHGLVMATREEVKPAALYLRWRCAYALQTLGVLIHLLLKFNMGHTIVNTLSSASFYFKVVANIGLSNAIVGDIFYFVLQEQLRGDPSVARPGPSRFSTIALHVLVGFAALFFATMAITGAYKPPDLHEQAMGNRHCDAILPHEVRLAF